MSKVTSINKNSNLKKKKLPKVAPQLLPATEEEWLEIMQDPSKMRDRIYACVETNDTIKICAMAADTAGLVDIDRITILAFHALVNLDRVQAELAALKIKIN